jgi:hypothetical protein
VQHSEFNIGAEFWCGGRKWRCIDIGGRTIIAIRVDRVEVGNRPPERRRVLSRAEAEAEGWFNGPPYAVVESVFDEYHLEGCSQESEQTPGRPL